MEKYSSMEMEAYQETQIKPPKVFLNFRGVELRQSFIAHLEVALTRGGVNVHVDQRLQLGDQLDVFKGIEESRIALVILSERYTESKWCLDELVKIQELVEQGKLMAIPIFYNLHPSVVESLDGEFGDNLWKLGKHLPDFDKLKQWKEALRFVSRLAGLVLNEKIIESKFIDNIVKHVLMALSRLPREADSATKAKFPGISRKEGGLNLRKDDDFLSEPNSGALPELQDREEKKQENVSESSAMVTYDQRDKVFISFRGVDVRRTFNYYLTKDLERNGVSVFKDVELKGSLREIIFKGMEESKIALVIFSSGYAASAWCLDNLVKIKELMDEGILEFMQYETEYPYPYYMD
ncbi:disease resistance protein LAZ5-like [Capsella rubella]|uniref:disease resistance protein LAZ5-like n=1 Tax=Capsella rubella TaxID=81985 RepID=UPI000CD53DCC|nr:disease resistance protein LAZ5-like [Capsella rubella]